jgi:hypothetical protein
MPAITWGLVLALILAREVYRWRRARKLRHTLELLEWRERFAKTRRDVIHLLHCGDTAPDSAIIVNMYLLASAVVRRATDYETFASTIVLEMIKEARPDQELAGHVKREIKKLTPEGREILYSFAGDLHQLLKRYSWLYRFIDFAARALRAMGIRPRADFSPPRHKPFWPAFQEKRAMYSRTAQWRKLATAA